MTDEPVVAGFRECGCLAVWSSMFVDGRPRDIAFETANWPAFGLETRIVPLSQARASPRRCQLCDALPMTTFEERWRRLSEMRQGVIDAIQVMTRILNS